MAEYRLVKISEPTATESSKIFMLDELSEEQFSLFVESNKYIEELTQTRRLLEFVLQNEEDIHRLLDTSIKSLTEKSKLRNSVRKNDLDPFFLNFNRLLLNYLSSTRTFLDHSSAYLSRKYGKASTELKEFKQMLSAFFDNSFTYRFFDKLRNYSQHVGIPVHLYSFQTHYDDVKHTVSGKLEIQFNRDKLLNSYDTWGKHVLDQLKSKEKEFDVMPLVFEMTQMITEIERNLELIERERVIEAVKYVRSIISTLPEEGWDVAVSDNVEVDENGKLKNISLLFVPIEMILFVENNWQTS
jgi:hypothetical protein